MIHSAWWQSLAGPVTGDPGGHWGSASRFCAGDSEHRSHTGVGAMGHSDTVSHLGPLLLIVMGLSVFSSVLQSKRLQKWWKKKKKCQTSKSRARPEKQSASRPVDGGAEKSRPCPAPACAGQPCPPAERRCCPQVPLGSGAQRPLFLLLCRASAEASSRKHLSPLAPLATMDSVPDRGSSSFSSLYSFQEPWPGAMAELSALNCSGPCRPPRAVNGRVGEPGPALCQEPPLELPTANEVPREGRDRVQSPVDKKPSPCSPPAMATDQGELIVGLLRSVESTQEMARQCYEMLKVLQAHWQGAAGACDWNLPGEPFHPLGRMEVQDQMGARVKPQHLGVERLCVGVNMHEAEDVERGQASPGLCPLGRCLCQCCTCLWHRLKDWWRRCCRPRRVPFSNFP